MAHNWLEARKEYGYLLLEGSETTKGKKAKSVCIVGMVGVSEPTGVEIGVIVADGECVAVPVGCGVGVEVFAGVMVV